jgi:hypothetical protein
MKKQDSNLLLSKYRKKAKTFSGMSVCLMQKGTNRPVENSADRASGSPHRKNYPAPEQYHPV